MAREYCEIPTSIWNDPRWRALDRYSQLTYITISVSPHVDLLGVTPVTLNRWAGLTNTDPVEVLGSLRRLSAAQWISIDEPTDELLIRDFMRFNRVDKMPHVLRNAAERAQHIISPIVRRALAWQLSQIGRDDARREAERILAGTHERSPRRPKRPAIPAAVRTAVYVRDGWRCVYCGLVFTPAEPGRAPEDQDLGVWLELDHTQPYSLGGGDNIDNLRSACSPCNQSRGVDDADLWAARIEG